MENNKDNSMPSSDMSTGLAGSTDKAQTMPTPGAPKASGNKSLLMLVGAVTVIIVVVLIAAFIMLNGDKGSKNDVSIDIASADSAVEAIDAFSRKTLADAVNSPDFDELDPENPLAMIDFAELSETLNNNADESSFLKTDSNVDLAGKTVHTALDLNAAMSDASNGDVSVELTLDIYESYPEDYDPSEIEVKTTEDYINLLSNLNEETLSEMFATDVELNGSVSLVTEDVDMSTDFIIVVVEEKAYINLDNISIDSAEAMPADAEEYIETLEENVFLVNLNELYDEIADISEIMGYSYSSMTTNQLAFFGDLENFEGTPEYRQLNQNLSRSLQEMDEEELEAFQRVAKVFQSEMVTFLEETELFTNVDSIDPIRETNATCVEGNLNTDGIITNFGEFADNMMEYILSDDAFEDEWDDIRTTRSQLSAQLDIARSAVDVIDLTVNMSSCDTDGQNRGVGFEFGMTNPSGEVVEIDMDILTVDTDSDHTIEAMEEDIDLTSDAEDALRRSL